MTMTENTTRPIGGVTACRNCTRYVALMSTNQPNVFTAHEFEADGFTPSNRRHSCGESDRRAYGPDGTAVLAGFGGEQP